VAIGVAVTAMLGAGGFPLQAQFATASGIVKNAAGQPVTGALIKISSEDLGLGFMVVSQEKGQYRTPKLLPGKYAVQGFGGSSQSASSKVTIGSGHLGSIDLVLDAPLQILPREKRMSDAEYEKLLPDGPGKKFAADQCTNCHSLLPVVSARKTREQWQQSYDRMLDDMYDMRKLMIYHQPSENSDLVLGYLAKSFGPDTPPDPRVMKEWLLEPGGPAHPNRNLPATLLKGAAAKYVALEFSLPAGAEPHDVAVDSQGVAWVSEKHTGMLGRFDPNSLAYTRIAVPPGKNPKIQLNAVTVDSHDQVWVADDGPNGRILQYDPKGKEFTSYLMPEYRFMVPPNIGWARTQTLRVTNGNVWAAGITSSRILKLDINSRKIIDYSVPKGSLPFGLVVAEDNSPWFTSLNSSQVIRVDSRTGMLTKYYVPNIQEKERTDLRGLAADADGNMWVVATEKGKLLKLDSRSGHFTEFSPPTEDAGPYSVDVDTKRNFIWFSEAYTDRIARFDPRTNTFVEFPHPSADSDVRRIEVDRSHPNRVWWAGNRSGKVGYIETLE
jgi:virginiamycin B lyase